MTCYGALMWPQFRDHELCKTTTIISQSMTSHGHAHNTQWSRGSGSPSSESTTFASKHHGLAIAPDLHPPQDLTSRTASVLLHRCLVEAQPSHVSLVTALGVQPALQPDF